MGDRFLHRVGFYERSQESRHVEKIIVGTREGVLKARSFRRKPEEYFKEVKGTPWEPVPGRERIEIKSRVTMPEEIKASKVPEGEEREIRSRRVKIFKSDI